MYVGSMHILVCVPYIIVTTPQGNSVKYDISEQVQSWF